MAVFGRQTLVSIGSDKVGFVTLDVSESEDHGKTAEPTQHPIEDGSDVADHVKQLPDTLTLTGTVSNTPVGFLAVDDPTRARNAYDNLVFMKEEAQPLDVVTAWEEYEGMVIKSLSAPRSAAIGDAVTVTVSLQRVRIVASKTGTAPQPKKATAKPTKNAGKKPTAAASEATSKGNQSILSKWSFGG
jgi:hypothetical protein